MKRQDPEWLRQNQSQNLLPQMGPRQYTVERGDTLSYLALRHYGDPFKWEKIYNANKETMKNPDYIYVGQRIIIPS